jgi:hypothetical protein
MPGTAKKQRVRQTLAPMTPRRSRRQTPNDMPASNRSRSASTSAYRQGRQLPQRQRRRNRQSPAGFPSRRGGRAPGRRRAPAARASAPPDDTSAPAPFGPPILCDETIRKSAPSAWMSRSMRPAACTASKAMIAAGSFGHRRNLARRLDDAGLVVGQMHRDQRHALALVLIAKRRRSSSMRTSPSPSTPIRVISFGGKLPAAKRCRMIGCAYDEPGNFERRAAHAPVGAQQPGRGLGCAGGEDDIWPDRH